MVAVYLKLAHEQLIEIMETAPEMLQIYSELDNENRALLLSIARGMRAKVERRIARPVLSLSPGAHRKTVVNMFDGRVDATLLDLAGEPVGGQ